MKFFMAAGQKETTKAQDCDVAAVLSALANLKDFDKKLRQAANEVCS